MKYSTSILAFASLASLVTAAPTKSLERRADSCGNTDTIPAGPYTINNNLWNAGSDPSGHQCSGVDSVTGDTIAWHTSWTWSGGGGVKSYANAELNFTPKPLSAVTSIPSTWDWSMNSGNFEADVSFDIFTDADASNTGSGDHHDYEIMIWLDDLGGANPISDSYNAAGGPNYVATGIQLAGINFDLAKGTSGAAGGGTVYSFVAEGPVVHFEGDIMDFFNYLQKYQTMPFSQNLVYVAAGTEPFTGSGAVLTTTTYNVAVN